VDAVLVVQSTVGVPTAVLIPISNLFQLLELEKH